MLIINIFQEHVVLLSLGGNTVEFVVTHSDYKNYQLNNKYMLNSGMIVRVLVQQQFKNVRAIRGAAKYVEVAYPYQEDEIVEVMKEEDEKEEENYTSLAVGALGIASLVSSVVATYKLTKMYNR